MIRLFDLFRSRRQAAAPAPAPVPEAPPAAAVAKERLQILLSHERADRGSRAEFLPALQKEILEAVTKYLVIDQEKVMVKLERGKDISFLEVNVELPGPDVPLLKPAKAPAADKPADPEAEAGKSSDKAGDKAGEKAEKPGEKAAEKPSDPSVASGSGPLAHSPA